MKQITIEMPNFKKIDWHSPINCISWLSVIGALIYMIYPEVRIYGAMWWRQAGIGEFSGALVLYSFLHGGILHVLSNLLFFLTIGRVIEIGYGKRVVWHLWVWTTLFVGIFLFLFSNAPTIGGSGFAMSILAVYAYNLYQHKHSDYKGALLLIFINLLIGFGSNISFMGHFAGALAGGIFAWRYKHKPHLQHFM